VVVVGVDGCLDTAFAQCCDPHPPTPIIGYLGRDQRIMIHASSCGTVNRNGARNLDRLIEVRWQSVDPATDYGTRRIRLCVETTDRERLLAEMTEAISAAYANIARAVARVVEDGKAINYFDILVDVPERADLILHALRDIPGVDRASRME
jgi:GTP pyrophosphokinase